jgi:hypothetical protein
MPCEEPKYSIQGKKKLKFVQFIRRIYELSWAKDTKALAQVAHPGADYNWKKRGNKNGSLN